MIISGGSRCNWRFFAKHLTNARDNERVGLVEVRGLAADNVLEAFREMDALATGTRCKNFFYHADLNPRQDERLTPEQWEQAADVLEAKLGLEGHSRIIVEHEKEGRTHRHVIWSRIDVDSMTAVSDSRNYARHEEAARELEQAFGQPPVAGVHGRDRDDKRPERRPKNWETFRGNKSGLDPETVKAEVTALWRESDSGKAFAAALDERGYVLCKGDRRDFCLVDSAGHEHSLARRIEGVKAAEVRARLADIERDTLPTVAEGRELGKAWKQPDTAARELVDEARRNRQFDEAMYPFVKDLRENGVITLHALPLTWRERATELLAQMRDTAQDFYDRAAETMRGWLGRGEGESWRERVERDGQERSR